MNITFIDAVKLFYSNYLNFDGRASRAEFWYPMLYMCIVSVILCFFGKFGEVLSGIFGLVNLIPGIAVSIRRMHDIGKSGWWVLVDLIPFIGWIWFIILAATPTKTEGQMKF